jgi:hypothetical protein
MVKHVIRERLVGWVARAVLAAVLGGCHPPPQPSPAQDICRAADALSERTVTLLQALAISTDSIEAASRDSLRLPPVPASRVTFVQDEATCRRGLQAFNAIQGTPSRPRRLQVYRYGPYFVVEDPDLEGEGEYRAVRIFDGSWKYQSTMATF